MQTDGYTGLAGGERLRKDHPVVECLGTLDELNAFLGDAKASAGGHAGSQTAEIITGIQKDLCSLMGVIAGMPLPEGGAGESRIASLIGELNAKLPPLAAFAVPGANAVSAKLHIARTVCRRAERRLVGLNLDEETRAAALPYINRLSDLLFALARASEQA